VLHPGLLLAAELGLTLIHIVMPRKKGKWWLVLT
jgi:hypothetical protein